MSNNVTVRLPILSTLGVVFIVLKLTGVIAWSWWLVLLPFYFWIAFLFGGAIFTGAVAAIVLGGAVAIDWGTSQWRKLKRQWKS